MHREERKLFAKLQATLGADNVTALHPDELSNSALDNANVLVITMDAGNVAQAMDMAHACNEAVARNPKLGVVFGLNGCGDDNREIDQIPAAKLTLQALCSSLSQAAFWRFDIEHQALMLVACGAGQRVGTQLHVPPWLVKDPNK